MPTHALLSCDVFRDEIEQLRLSTGVPLGSTAWLEMGLHDHPDRLRAAIQATLATLEADPATNAILLAYGLCGNGLMGVRAGRCPLVLPRAHDCISIFLGGPAAHEAVLKADPGTYFYSPGWIRGRRVPGPDREAHLRAHYAPRYPDDPEIVDDLIEADRSTFAHHGCAAYVDLTDNPAAEAYCQDCAHHLGWQYRRLPGDPALLRDLLTGPWDDARFLVVPPGHQVALAPDGKLRAVRTPPPAITVQPPGGKSWALPPPTSDTQPLSTWLEDHGHPLNTRCGGRGLCRGCHVHLDRAAAPAAEPVRACQLTTQDLPADLAQLRIPLTSQRDATLHGVTVFELRHPGPPPPPRPGIGLALDIGTTTVAGALWDFSTGHCLAEASVANAQRRHGDNVVTRISFSLDHADGLARLRLALLDESLRPLLATLCRTAGIEPAAITQANAAGNPAMLHTLAGATLTGLATFPFHPVFLGDRSLAATDHDLPFSCPLDLLPALGPFVGADISAGALASGLLAGEAPVLLIDFGTNGEILLKHANGYLATATAAGPAFEGGRLACGAPARTGVISSFTRENSVWHWTLTGGGSGRPQGISGAAYVDFIAVGARDGLINSFGRFNRQHPGIITVADAAPGAAVRIALTDDLYVSEADVAELLQAKAAIAAGVATLLEVAGLAATDLRALYVAGGFGYHLQPAHAQAIGLWPAAVPLDRIALIGNSSLGGASLLLHPHQRPALDALLAHTRVIELNQIPTFEDHFTDALSLPE